MPHGQKHHFLLFFLSLLFRSTYTVDVNTNMDESLCKVFVIFYCIWPKLIYYEVSKY